MTIIAGKGFSRFFKGLTSVYGEWIMLGDDMFKIVELDTAGSDCLYIEGFKVASTPVEHREESLAYRITGPDKKSIVYSFTIGVLKNQ